MTKKPAKGQRSRADEPELTPELELLLDRIQCGTIEDLDDMAAEDMELLRGYCRDGEDLEALFDRLRGESRDGR